MPEPTRDRTTISAPPPRLAGGERGPLPTGTKRGWPLHWRGFAVRILPYMIGAVLLIAAVWIVAIIIVSTETKEHIAQSARNAEQLAGFFEQQTAQTYRYADSYLKSARKEYVENGGVAAVENFMRVVPLDRSIVSHITIIGTDGVPLLVSGHRIKPGTTAADREYFKFQQSNAGDQIFVSLPRRGRNSGKLLVRLVRRINQANGSFGGVIFAALDVDQMTAFFQLLNLGSESSATLVGTDKKIRARSSYGRLGPGQDISGSRIWSELEQKPTGLYEQTSVVDGISRYYAYRKLAEFPLIVAIGVSLSDISAATAHGRQQIYWIAIFITVVIMILTTVICREILVGRRLKDSELRFKGFAEASADWFWEMDAALRFVYLSPNVERVLGSPPEWFYGKTREDLAGKRAADNEWQAHLDGMRQQLPFRDFRFQWFGDDGEQRWISSSGVPVYDDGGDFAGYRGTSRDVTSEVETREAYRLAESRTEKVQARLTEAIESLSEAFALFDAEDRLVLCNDRYREMYALVEDIIVPGVSFETIIRAGAERGNIPEAEGRIEEWVSERIREHRNPTGPYEVQRADARWLRIEERRTGDGGIVGVRSDITDRKRAEEALRHAEERFRAIFEQAAVGIGLMTPAGRFLTVNKKLSELMKRDEAELFGMRFEEFTHPDDYETCIRKIAQLVDGSLSTFTTQMRYQLDDDEMLWGNLTISVVREPDSDRYALLGIVEDITEQRQAEEQLRQAQKMKAVGQLTGGVAHDFNNLLAVVLGNLELTLDRVRSDGATRRLVDTAIRATTRGADLTQRLLAFSRKQALNPQEFDLNDLVHDSVQILARTLGEDIKIELNLGRNLPSVVADRNQLENALLNIALNARDAMPGGGGLSIETARIDIDQGQIEEGNGISPVPYVMLAIRDTGAGMSSKVLEHAFEPFFTTKDVGEGSGLGLSMVYGFAKQSGGHVDIESIPGDGTTIRLYLPLVAPGETELAPPKIAEAVVPGGNETILIVEDDPEVRTLVRAIIEGAGYRVLEADDGPTAIALLEELPKLDLVLSDIMLTGGMNGMELG